MSEAPTIELCDVTCRDGDQSRGVNLSTQDKLLVLRKDDCFGLAYAEGGFPRSNPTDQAVFEQLKNDPLHSTALVAFGMTRRKGIPAEQDLGMQALLASGAPAIAVVGKSSRFQVETALKTTPKENLAMIRDSVAYLLANGAKEVLYDAEHFFDAFGADPDYALDTLRAAHEAGARRLILCDTIGHATPDRVGRTVSAVHAAFQEAILGFHPHEDRGLAVANVLAAVREGVRHVQGTWNGIGERCGNVDLFKVIPNLTLEGYHVLPEEQMKHLTTFSEDAARRMKIRRHPGQAFVGENAYAHKGGMHVSAMERDLATYESRESPPERWGNERIIVGSKQSGLANVRHLVAKPSCAITPTLKQQILGERSLQEKILRAQKKREARGYTFDRGEASLTLLMLRAIGAFTPKIRIIESEIHSTLSVHAAGEIPEDVEQVREEADGIKNTRAIVLVGVNGDAETEYHEVAKDDGPIGALSEAVLKALEHRFPQLRQLKLVDYIVEKAPNDEGTHSKVQVTVEWEDGEDRFYTVGVSGNSIEAGWQCVIDGYEYKLLKDDVLASARAA
ncbi:TPA: citramalate synthase [Candidatus Peribacteria bacterium]|nr:MAG: citramalate synthase [Candidatus Peribacteria bacterium RIFOXYC2_FULL_58_10]OGJ83903.1 MAG: citramalate synthase [Candidatus Peribacteria bacterium RIFOXYD2_FULL_58_15]HAI98585.1 citramalate synthase [Candidatus Peribacteria bacterium]HAS34298.1 citramalate synthase [Candidatus Peribacteria bacterium]